MTNVYRYNNGRIIDRNTAIFQQAPSPKRTVGYDVVFHPLKPLAAHLALSTAVAVWDLAKSVPHRTLFSGRSNCTLPLTCLSSTIQLVVAGRSDGCVLVWPWQSSPTSSTSLPTMKSFAHKSPVLAIAAVISEGSAADSALSMSAESVVLHNLQTGVMSDEIRILAPEVSPRTRLSTISLGLFAASAKICVVATCTLTVVIESRSGKVTRSSLHSPVTCLTVCPRSARFSVGMEDGSIAITGTSAAGQEMNFELEMDFEKRLVLQLHRGPVATLSCTASRIFSSSNEGDFSVLLTSWCGQTMGRLAIVTSPVVSIAVNHRYGTFATAMGDSSVKVWRSDGALLCSFRGHIGDIVRVAFHDLGGLVGSVGDDLSLRTWALPKHVHGAQSLTLASHLKLEGLTPDRCDSNATQHMNYPGSEPLNPTSPEPSIPGRESGVGQLQQLYFSDIDAAEASGPLQPHLNSTTRSEGRDDAAGEPVLIEITTDTPSSETVFDEATATLIQAICQSGQHTKKFSAGIVHYATTHTKNLRIRLQHRLETNGGLSTGFSTDSFLAGIDCGEWSSSAAPTFRLVTQKTLQSALSTTNCPLILPALTVASIPSPLVVGIRNFLLIFACNPGSPLAPQMLAIGSLLHEVDKEVMRLQRFRGNVAFRWSCSFVPCPEPGTEILFSGVGYCTSSPGDVATALQSEETDCLSGTVVVIHTTQFARSLDVAIGVSDVTKSSSLLPRLLFCADGLVSSVIFSPFQRFAAGDSSSARDIFLRAAAQADQHLTTAMLTNVSFWMLYELPD
jgi:WD40 repeat protein